MVKICAAELLSKRKERFGDSILVFNSGIITAAVLSFKKTISSLSFLIRAEFFFTIKSDVSMDRAYEEYLIVILGHMHKPVALNC